MQIAFEPLISNGLVEDILIPVLLSLLYTISMDFEEQKIARSKNWSLNRVFLCLQKEQIWARLIITVTVMQICWPKFAKNELIHKENTKLLRR